MSKKIRVTETMCASVEEKSVYLKWGGGGKYKRKSNIIKVSECKLQRENRYQRIGSGG